MKSTEILATTASSPAVDPVQNKSGYRTYVREKISTGLADIRAGRIHSHASIRREFLRISGH